MLWNLGEYVDDRQELDRVPTFHKEFGWLGDVVELPNVSGLGTCHCYLPFLDVWAGLDVHHSLDSSLLLRLGD